MDWPHAPLHRLSLEGTYIVTAGTLHKAHVLNSAEALDIVQRSLLTHAERYGWALQTWAILSNHYHFIVAATSNAKPLGRMIRHVHGDSARELNCLQGEVGRQVWYQSWDTRITGQRAYLARLKYVTLNPVRHGVARRAEDYPWCAASWFAENVSKAFFDTVMSFPIDTVHVVDDFGAAALAEDSGRSAG